MSEIEFKGFNGEPLKVALSTEHGQPPHHDVYLLNAKGERIAVFHIGENLIDIFPSKSERVYVSLESDYLGTERGKNKTKSSKRFLGAAGPSFEKEPSFEEEEPNADEEDEDEGEVQHPGSGGPAPFRLEDEDEEDERA